MSIFVILNQDIIDQIELEVGQMDPFIREYLWDYKDMWQRYHELEMEWHDINYGEWIPDDFDFTKHNDW